MEGSGDDMIEVLFFGSWTVDSPNELFLACVVVGVMSFALQCLVSTVTKVPGAYVPHSYMGRCYETSHIVHSLVHFARVALALLLINCALADCPYIFIATVIGFWLGYLVIEPCLGPRQHDDHALALITSELTDPDVPV